MKKLEEIKAIKPTQEDMEASFEEPEHQEDRFKIENTSQLEWGELKKNLIAMPDGRVITSDGELVEGAKSLSKPSEFKLKSKNENGAWEDIK